MYVMRMSLTHEGNNKIKIIGNLVKKTKNKQSRIYCRKMPLKTLNKKKLDTTS